MKGFRKLGEPLLARGLTSRLRLGSRMTAGGGPAPDTTAPTLTIEALSAVANVVAMRITASEEVTGFEVGDLTITEGGSLASFATADNTVFTVSWTLAAGANTMDIAANVCQDAAGNNNTAATQYAITYLVLQPDATAGIDTFLGSGAPTINNSTNTALQIGEWNGGTFTGRTLIKFDFSSIPAGSSILSAVLSLYCITDLSSNASTFSVYRMLRAWVEAQATWNVYTTGNAWPGGAGGFGAADCEQSAIGSRSMTATETLNEWKTWTLTAAAIEAMIPSGVFTNNGFMVRSSAEANDMYEFASSDHATAGNRPKLEVVYLPQ